MSRMAPCIWILYFSGIPVLREYSLLHIRLPNTLISLSDMILVHHHLKQPCTLFSTILPSLRPFIHPYQVIVSAATDLQCFSVQYQGLCHTIFLFGFRRLLSTLGGTQEIRYYLSLPTQSWYELWRHWLAYLIYWLHTRSTTGTLLDHKGTFSYEGLRHT